MEGVGIYWFIVERLAIAGGKLPTKIIPVLAMQMQVTETKVKAVIQSFELFIVENDDFFSRRLLENISIMEDIQSKRKDAANKRWSNNNNAKQMVL